MEKGNVFYKVVNGENRPMDSALQARFTEARQRIEAMDSEVSLDIGDIVDIPVIRGSR